ncbi:hypothetical protein ACTHOQ_16305 [Solibacillus silvestris]|uniref:hypothetical protein n=1 Tax=Solibacillus silvestris TaxID=76853 RepID=UPI003F808C4E
MDPITKALTDELDGKQLSQKAKQEILAAKPRKRRNFISQITAFCICAVVLFLLITNTEKTPPQMTAANSMLGPVDEAILQYFNNEAPKLQTELEKREDSLQNGDAYLIRLALERNSTVFYGDSSLTPKDRFLISELLHYMQEAIWHNNIRMEVKHVQTIKQLVEAAPVLISKMKPYVEIPYMKIAEEKNRQWNFYSFDTAKWVSYFAVLAMLLAAIVYLFKNNHRIIGALVIFLAVASFSQPFWKPFKDVTAYDEKTFIQVVERGLKEMNIKVTGRPELQYAASIHKTRTALVSFEDGMSVLAVFKYENGQYIKQGMTWHSGKIFSENTFDKEGDENIVVSAIAFKSGHNVIKFRIRHEDEIIAETLLSQQKPMIVYFKKQQETSSMQYEFLDENGELAQ